MKPQPLRRSPVRRPPLRAATIRVSPRGSSRPWGVYGIIGLVILLLLGAGIAFLPSGALPLFPTPTFPGPTATWTPSPTPTLAPDLANAQLEATIAHNTRGEVVDVKCTLLGGCKQVYFALTLITEDLLAQTAIAELTSAGNYTPVAFQARFEHLKTGLRLDEYLVFALTLSPAGESGLFPKNEELILGPLQQNLVLVTKAGQEQHLDTYEGVWDLPLSPNTVYKSYVYFSRKDDAGYLFEDLNTVTVQLKFNRSLKTKRSNILWTFDFLTSPPVVTLTPTPTVGPTPTLGPPTPTPVVLIDRGVIMAILELLTELARRPAGP